MLLHDRIERSGVVLTLPDWQERELEVRAEPVRLEQVLVNLLQNALDATEAGGAIAIELAAGAEHCELTVTDDGVGLADNHERLFQPFATTKRDGLGLGLVISRDIMRGLHGELSIEPSEQGARFVMKIPRA
jgi:two-component system C4-dicarboxylate transport sensor histidine kinase DctB